MADIFPFQPYDLLLAFAGVALLLITLGHGLLERLNINSTYVYLLVGVLAGLLLDMAPDDPLTALPVVERVAEAAVVIGLVVLGIRIGRPISWSGWQSTVRLILIVKPATMLGVAAAGVWILGLPLGPAVLLAAILAPTDPILAGPLEEHSPEEDPEDEFGLSSEAGLNDGLAFPFVYLGIYLTLQPGGWEGWALEWLLVDLVYAVAVALPLGWLAGRFCGDAYVRLDQRDAVSHSRRLFVPLAMVLAIYGLIEALGGYGFLAAFTAGHGFRHAFEDHPDRLRAFADFAESVDELAKGALLLMVGALIPWSGLWSLRWETLAFALVLMVILRPGLTMLATAGGRFTGEERVYWAWFGIRGIGSLYYLTYALGHGVEGAAAETLFIVTIGTVLASVLLHGLTVRPVLARLRPGEPAEE
jgi:sodium/hydrogen antiporter